MMRLLLLYCTAAIMLVESHASFLRHRRDHEGMVELQDNQDWSRALQTQEPTLEVSQEETREETQEGTQQETQEETQEETQDSTSVPSTEVPTEACCDPEARLYCFVGDAACCLDGTWACSNDGIGEQYFCDGENTTDPQGKICSACCDPLLEPGFFGNPLCFEGHRCCTDGTWACNSGIEGIFICGGEEVTSAGPFGEKCACPEDEFECPDGTFVERDPTTCEFLPCPEEELRTENCCSPLIQVDCESGDPACCDDGSWACPTSGEMYTCSGQETMNPSGEICDVKCCNPLREPGKFGNNIAKEGYACCPDTGEWSYSIGDAKTFTCGGELTTGPFSKACRLIFCTNEQKECPDGSRVGLDPGSGCSEFYPCPDEN